MQDLDKQPGIYRDEDVTQAIQELFSYQNLVDGMRSFLPEELCKLILEEKKGIKSIHDFQQNIISPVLKWIEKTSISRLSASGLGNLAPGERYLFISNHKDIVLDSAFLNMALFDNGFTPSQIAIGDNLMKHRISELIFRINKSFVVKRSGTPVELYHYSVKLSEYIHRLIQTETDSVWIAQRGGRSKDGNDWTQVALLKMLGLSSQSDLKTHFQQLHVVPVSISYEFDPCDLLKTEEHLRKQADPQYKKSFSEDIEYILLGLKGRKGHVHFHFNKPLQDELDVFDTVQNNKKQLELLAGIIDKAIHLNYELHAINYVAHDLLLHKSQYANHYSAEEFQVLTHLFESKISKFPNDWKEEGRRYLLGIYANPLINMQSHVK
ncbi:MAG: 1-acyl-sn-glycerol-3-phosphate acyltransferase [Saprospiraceae bacterium]|jgi:hypothetical protein|nr:1-acyl-sn-glycerol-3-phosphate acyltransferase [Saprospiraceae bacterium]